MAVGSLLPLPQAGGLKRTQFVASQYGQDRFVLDVLGGMRGGFFLDSGASDGVTVNNTLVLEREFGWTGICVEPNREFFAELVKNRGCLCVNSCLYDRVGPVDFIEDAKVLGGIVDEYHPDHLRFARDAFGLLENEQGRLATIRKHARTIGSVLLEHGAPRLIDYWSLDTEGSELAILRSFPFDEYAFRVLTVEHNWLPVRAEIRELMERRGYEFAGALEIDDCYVMPGLRASRPAWRSGAWARARRRA